MQPIEFSGIILAGGQSRRLGRDKRFLLLAGRPLIAHVIERLQPLVSEIIIAAPDPDAFAGWNARIVPDLYPDRGVLAGLHAGLTAARGRWAFVIAADLPRLNPALLRAMADRARISPADTIVPQWQGALEPLHALYRPAACAPAAEAALRREERRIIAFYPDVQIEIFPENEVARRDPAGHSFFNVNTPEEWEKLQALDSNPPS
jgi:molybdopterin-guanine dinucleotide biosynthesis protein A